MKFGRRCPQPSTRSSAERIMIRHIAADLPARVVSMRSAHRHKRDENARSSVMKTRQLPTTRQSDLFAAEPILPAGFAYGEEVISSDDEEALLKRFETLLFKPFEFHTSATVTSSHSDGATTMRAGRSGTAMPSRRSCFRCATGRRPSLMSPRKACSKSSSTNIHPAPALAGIETSRCSKTLSQSRSRRRASYGFAASRGLDGNAPQKTFVPARPICCAVSRVGTGSTASPLSIACAIR